ncbi:MAG: adenine phosphoribosyltransferase [Bacteroidota bacterium]
MTELSRRIDQSIRTILNFPKEGIQFKDITPLFLDPQLCSDISDFLAEKAVGKVDVVCGVESRGFLFGATIAQKLHLPFVLIRKSGKLPGDTEKIDYELEYGSSAIEVHKGFIQPGQRVLIHDDLLATGGTAAATASLIEKCGAIPAQFSFIIELAFLEGRKALEKYPADIITAITYS